MRMLPVMPDANHSSYLLSQLRREHQHDTLRLAVEHKSVGPKWGGVVASRRVVSRRVGRRLAGGAGAFVSLLRGAVLVAALEPAAVECLPRLQVPCKRDAQEQRTVQQVSTRMQLGLVRVSTVAGRRENRTGSELHRPPHRQGDSMVRDGRVTGRPCTSSSPRWQVSSRLHERAGSEASCTGPRCTRQPPRGGGRGILTEEGGIGTPSSQVRGGGGGGGGGFGLHASGTVNVLLSNGAPDDMGP